MSFEEQKQAQTTRKNRKNKKQFQSILQLDKTKVTKSTPIESFYKFKDVKDIAELAFSKKNSDKFFKWRKFSNGLFRTLFSKDIKLFDKRQIGYEQRQKKNQGLKLEKLLNDFYINMPEQQQQKENKKVNKKDKKVHVEKIDILDFESHHIHPKMFRKFIKHKMKNENFLIQEEQRKKIWLYASGTYESINQNHGYYEKLLISDQYPEKYDELIYKDIERSFGQEMSQIEKKMKEDRPSIIDQGEQNEYRIYDRQMSIDYIEYKKKAMFNVLVTYSKRNMDIGYCQGFNFILKQIMFDSGFELTEEEGFWFLTNIMEIILPVDYFPKTMAGLMSDQKILRNLLQVKYTEVDKKIEEAGLCIDIFSTQWLICLYSQTLQNDMATLFLDHFIIQGSISLFKMGIILIEHLKPVIMKLNGFEIIWGVEQQTKAINNKEIMNKKLCELYLSKKTIKVIRELYHQNLQNQMKKGIDSTMDLDFSDTVTQKSVLVRDYNKCENGWPICLYRDYVIIDQQICRNNSLDRINSEIQMNGNIPEYEHIKLNFHPNAMLFQFYVYREGGESFEHHKINWNYFTKEKKLKIQNNKRILEKRNESMEIDSCDNLLIQRSHHNCNIIVPYFFGKQSTSQDDFSGMAQFTSGTMNDLSVKAMNKIKSMQEKFAQFQSNTSIQEEIALENELSESSVEGYMMYSHQKQNQVNDMWSLNCYGNDNLKVPMNNSKQMNHNSNFIKKSLNDSVLLMDERNLPNYSKVKSGKQNTSSSNNNNTNNSEEVFRMVEESRIKYFRNSIQEESKKNTQRHNSLIFFNSIALQKTGYIQLLASNMEPNLQQLIDPSSNNNNTNNTNK